MKKQDYILDIHIKCPKCGCTEWTEGEKITSLCHTVNGEEYWRTVQVHAYICEECGCAYTAWEGDDRYEIYK